MFFSRVCVVYIALVFMMSTVSESKLIRVGGKEDSWTIPSSTDTLSAWSSKNRFKIGDILLWTYDAKVDSVLQVTQESFEKCNKTSPMSEFKDGKTEIQMKESGPHYFISGAEGHCEKGQKVDVVVLSAGHKAPSVPIVLPPIEIILPAPVPAPAPDTVMAPAPAPAGNGGEGIRGGALGVVLGSLVVLAMM